MPLLATAMSLSDRNALFPAELRIEVRLGTDDAIILLSRHPDATEWAVRYRYGSEDWRRAARVDSGTYVTPYYRIPADAIAWELGLGYSHAEHAELEIEHPALGVLRFPHPR